jgi:hypothetical protein
MKNVYKLFAAMRSIAIIALVAAIGFAMAACDNDPGGDPEIKPGIGGTYFFEADGETYVLVVSDDGEYELTVIGVATGTEKKSTGKAKKSGGTYTLTPAPSDSAAEPFTVTVNASGVTGVNGTITFDDGETQEAPAEVEPLPPENVPEEYRWTIRRDPSSTATIEDFSVDGDTAAITIGGTPEPNADGVWQAWKITAEYKYTVKVGSAYKYVIEAWTEEESDRYVNVQYYEDVPAGIYMSGFFWLTDTPTQYTIYGQKLPKKGEPVRFQCAAFTGKFYLKIISIEEYEPGELTITNFRGTPSLRANSWTTGDAQLYVDDEWVNIEFDGFNIPATGNSKTVNVYNVEQKYVPEEDGWLWFRTTPFNETATVTAGYLRIDQWGDNDYHAGFLNKVPITFTKGKASINFGTQMMKAEDFDWDNVEGGNGTPEPPGGGDMKQVQLEGTWLEEDGAIMTIAGNTVTVTSEGTLYGSGTFTIAGSTLKVTFNEGELAGTFSGNFSLSDNGNTLTMATFGEDTIWTVWTRHP